MATGIVSTAVQLVGPVDLSRALEAAALLLGLVLAGGYLGRLTRHWGAALADLRNPENAFGFFSLTAGLNVLAGRLVSAGHPLPGAVLAGLSLPTWLALTYGIPGALLLGPRPQPIANGINGSWFMWVVATESLATVCAALDRPFGAPTEGLAAAAAAFWAIGVVLYLMLITLVLLRLLSTPVSPPGLHPSYWIYMGATAITTLAGAQILALPHRLPVLRAAGPVISGWSFTMWSFGSWWVPLLVLFGVWRHLLRREPLAYDTGLWTIVFPLGMFAVASVNYGRVDHLAFMVSIGRYETWVAFASWLMVSAGMLVSPLLRSRQRTWASGRSGSGHGGGPRTVESAGRSRR
jgi:tellurite resistance protein TehA-like permease